MKQLGVEHVKPIVTRGVLVDVAGLKGVEVLPAGYEVTVADVRAALEREGIAEGSIQPGDAIFVNYGTSKGWTDPKHRVAGPPSGIGMEVARWIVEKQAAMIGVPTSFSSCSRRSGSRGRPARPGARWRSANNVPGAIARGPADSHRRNVPPSDRHRTVTDPLR